MEKDPLSIVITGMVEYIWSAAGEGSATTWRYLGKCFYDKIQESGGDLNTKESAIDTIKSIFTDKWSMADEVIVEENNNEFKLKIKNCALSHMTKDFESKGIPRNFCPYLNTFACAFENLTGDVYICEKNETAGNLCEIDLKKL